ncbi:MAG: glycosyltransferase [Patescibacteria group bacterium]
MKVLSIGTDRKIFEEGSAVRERAIKYGKLFDELHMVVFSTRIMNYESRIKISENVFVYPTNSRNKLLYISDAFKISKPIIHNSDPIIQDLVISAQDPFETGIVGLLLKLRYGLSLQIQLHTDFANKYFIIHSFLNFLRFPLGLFVLSFADSVRVVSNRIKRSINSLSHNIVVLPIYTHINELRIKNYELSKNSEIIKFLTVARLEKEKDLETAIKAFALADLDVEDPERSRRTVFTIVGDGSERESLELLAKSLEIEHKVKFVGWQSDLTEFYQNADIYISTSLYEGYGMSVVEAASYGLPLVLSDAGVAGDFFKDKEEALICKQKDVNGFAQAMSLLLPDLVLRKNMGQKAKEAVSKYKISYSEYLEKYKNLMKQAQDFHNLNYGLFKKNILLRYLVAGIIAASTNIGLLYIFTDIFKIWYLYSSLLSFVIAVVLSFILQKFWTFNDRETEKVHHQFGRFLGVAILGIGINTVCMYILVDILSIWYIFAQIITGAIIAIFNFLMYKFFIFRQK